VRQEDRRLAVGHLPLGRRGVGQRQVARQPGQPGQALAAAQAGAQRDGAALRKAGQHDALCRYATRLFAVDQALHGGHRSAQAGLVLAPREIGAQDVVPGAHRVAVVDA
jgi:hypothetical protein